MSIKDEVLFIGVGQAGGNICQLFEDKGYNVLCINTSKQDLDTLTVKHKYHIAQENGCSKQRYLAKEYIKRDFDNIVEVLKKYIADAKIIFVAFSAGGGTGSGAGPALCKILKRKYPSTTICMITILPDVGESFQANANAYECFQDILKVSDSGACFVLDNAEFGNKLEINQQFVNDFDDFIKIPELDKSISSNIDVSEIYTALSAHNMAMIVSVPSTQNNMASLFSSVEDSIFAKIEKDNIIKYLTLSLGDETILESEIKKECQKTFGTPIDSFVTYNQRNTNICMLSGLSYPATRLAEIASYVEANKNLIVDDNNKLVLNADMSFLRKKSAKAISSDPDDIDDIWDEFM